MERAGTPPYGFGYSFMSDTATEKRFKSQKNRRLAPSIVRSYII